MTWTLAYCTLDRSPLFDIHEPVERTMGAVAAAGFGWITSDIFTLRAHRDANNGSVAAYRAALDAHALRSFDLSGVTISDDADATFAELDEFLFFADQLDALWIQSRMTVDSPRSRSIYRDVAARVADAGRGLAFEYSPFVPLQHLRDAAALVADIATTVARQSVIIDTWHFYRTGDTLDDLRALDPALFGYIQLDDALPLGDDLRYDTLHRRALPGEGILALREFLDECETLGLTGMLSVEVLNEDLRTLPVEDYCGRVMRATQRVIS